MKIRISDINKFLTCSLCNGYFRECHTITECIHSFCKSCLIDHVYPDTIRPNLTCPTCNINLGLRPFSRVIYDRNIQAIVDKIYPLLLAKKETPQPSAASSQPQPIQNSSSTTTSMSLKTTLTGKTKFDPAEIMSAFKRSRVTSTLNSSEPQSGLNTGHMGTSIVEKKEALTSSSSAIGGDDATIIMRVTPSSTSSPKSLPPMLKPAFMMKVTVTMKKVKVQISKRLALLNCIVDASNIRLERDGVELGDESTAKELLNIDSTNDIKSDICVTYEKIE